MSRRNIFSLIADNTNQEIETGRLKRLFSDDKLVWYSDAVGHTIRQYVDEYCFFKWKNRGHCLDLEDYLDILDYGSLLYDAGAEVEAYLTLIELILNMWKLTEQSLSTENGGWRCSEGFYHLHDIMTEELSHYNHKAIYDEENEQVLVVEDKPEVTAVAEITEPTVALDIVRYNHHSMGGNITEKRRFCWRWGASWSPGGKPLRVWTANLRQTFFTC